MTNPPTAENQDYQQIESNVPNAFIVGLSFTASRGLASDIPPSELEHIPVGIQDHSIQAGSMTITGRAEGPLQARIDASPSQLAQFAKENSEASTEQQLSELFSSPIADDAEKTAKRLLKNNPLSAREIAKEAERKRVSRRLLLTERSKKLTVTCPITGIVSLVEVPAIPFPANNPSLAKTLQWNSPFADLANCRGIAQQGINYLIRLETQVLAGVIIPLADSYELFRFQPFDSGAQKNAILRTAGKEHLIDAIILIETLIHSGNCSYLPKLSLVFDSNLEEFGLMVRMNSYLKLLAEAIAKPDKEVWDEKKAKPQYPIRPVYIKDVEAGKKKISFLARQEQQRAKKEFAEDKKAGKIALSQLQKQVVMTDKLRQLLSGMMSDEGMLVMPPVFVEMVITKLETAFADNANAQQLVKILKKDRKALTLQLSELEEDIQQNLVDDSEDEADQTTEAEGPDTHLDSEEQSEEQILDSDNEEEQELNDEAISESNEESNEEYESSESDEAIEDSMESPIDGPFYPRNSLADSNASSSDRHTEIVELKAPEGLTAWEQLLWKKKMQKATIEKRNIVQNDIPSTATYQPSNAKEKLGKG